MIWMIGVGLRFTVLHEVEVSRISCQVLVQYTCGFLGVPIQLAKLETRDRGLHLWDSSPCRIHVTI